jgi:hypothetical protein
VTHEKKWPGQDCNPAEPFVLSNPPKGKTMNAHSDITAAPERQVLDYRHIEGDLHTVRNMAEIACEQVERVQGRFNQTDAGYCISSSEMQLLCFAVNHVCELADFLMRKWEEIHDSNVGARS